VTTKTTEDMLVEARRQIDELETRTASGAAATRARLQDRIALLREEEASAWAAVREKAEAVDEKIRQLEIEIAIAESRLDAELADDATAYAEAVEAELEDWDAAIERLQTRAATRAGVARERAEAEIAGLRQERNRATERLTALRAASLEAWHGEKGRIEDALNELERTFRRAAGRTPEEGDDD
jgi:hypothetical protein